MEPAMRVSRSNESELVKPGRNRRKEASQC